MSVDFAACNFCGDIFCANQGDDQTCECCNRRWCSKECGFEDGFELDEETSGAYDYYICGFCRDKKVEDGVLLEFIIEKMKLDKEEWTSMYLQQKGSGD